MDTRVVALEENMATTIAALEKANGKIDKLEDEKTNDLMTALAAEVATLRIGRVEDLENISSMRRAIEGMLEDREGSEERNPF